MAENEVDVLFQAKAIRMEFSGVEVLHGINFELRRGEIHALIGENGAGKSTLCKIITGNEKPTAGELIYKGQAYVPENAREAIERGISMVYQEFNLAPALSIAQNIYLGREPKIHGRIDEKRMIQNAKEILERLGIMVSPDRAVKKLTVYQQQLTEIARCVAYNSDIMILDEPTAPLSMKETRLLFNVMEELRNQGTAIIFITHRLEEIFEIADRVTVMRDGKDVGVYEVKDVERDFLIRQMIGRDLSQMYQYTREGRSIKQDDVVIRVQGLSSQKRRISDVSFELHKGEILGFMGLVGAGRSEVMRAVLGLDDFDTGKIEVKGREVHHPTMQQMYRMGVGYVPEDRKACGIIANLDITANVTLTVIDRYTHRFVVSKKEEQAGAQEIVDMLNIRCSGLNQKVRSLSGGNQQKTVFGRSIIMNGDILILDEPTRGVDVGAKAEIYNIIMEFCKRGGSVIIISSEQLEIMGVCDRAIVMCEGRITGDVAREDFTEEVLTQLMFDR